ncbi:MAG: toxin-antitoxin system YwqK family antitoxin [Paludibacteraceae bacterium]|nr:toxin-antitoxin system YwqK family antitoxin [Paludibacteraceae bacterium]
MKRIIALLLAGFSLVNIMAATPNQTDKKGRKQGAWSKTYANGQLMYEGQFKDDKPVGTFKRYFETGKLKLVQTYTKGENSNVSIYEDDGKTIAMEGAYIGKEKDGEWKFYKEGKLAVSETYTKGSRNGLSKAYSEKGAVIEETPYVNDKIEGVKRTFLEDGSLYQEVEYKNGLEDGFYKLYEGNKEPVITGQHKNGKRDGEWKIYDEKGQVDEVLTYENGKQTNAKEQKKKHSKTFDQKDAEHQIHKEPTELFPGSTVKNM